MARYSVGRRRALVLLVLTTLLLVVLDQSESPLTRRVRSVGASVLAPLKRVSRAAARPVQNAWHGVFDYDRVVAENKNLRLELEEVEGNRAVWEANIRQYVGLLKDKELTWLGDYETESAQVLSGSASPFEETVEIDIGDNRGIKPGMPVITRCLIGKVSQVYARTAKIRLITDDGYTMAAQAIEVPDGEVVTGISLPPAPTSTITATSSTTSPGPLAGEAPTATLTPITLVAPTTVPVTSQPPITPASTTPAVPATTRPRRPVPTTIPELDKIPAQETGSLEGRGGGRLPVFELVQNDEQGRSVQRGSIVVTSGANFSLAPRGFPIGYVINRVENASESGPILEVQPCGDIDNLSFVNVVLYTPLG